MNRLGGLSALVLVGSLIACGSDGGNGPGEGEGPGEDGKGDKGVTIGPDGRPVAPDGTPVPPKMQGKYELATEFDLTQTGLLPDIMNDTLGALSNFKEHPSQTIVDLAKVAGVPVIPQILSAIPGALRDPLFGWIDDTLFKALYNAVPVMKRVTEVLDDLASIATRFNVITTLDMPEGDAQGDATAFHSIAGVGYHWSDKLHVIKTPALIGSLTAKKVDTNAVLLDKAAPDLETGRLKVGDHTFTVPIGTFAVYAMDELSRDKFGAADFRAMMGKVIDCEKLAEAVSKKCIDVTGPIPGGDVCVGHKTELKQFCTVGLDLIVGTIKGQIKNFDIPAMELVGGTAEMWDAPVKDGPLDGTVDRIDNGFWNTTIKLSKEPRQTVAIFNGHRVGEASPPGFDPLAPK